MHQGHGTNQQSEKRCKNGMPNRLEGGPELLDGMWDLPGSQAVALLVKASPALLVALVA